MFLVWQWCHIDKKWPLATIMIKVLKKDYHNAKDCNSQNSIMHKIFLIFIMLNLEQLMILMSWNGHIDSLI